jgi:anti-sigma regulatory factor (Ser/Thr protein kinase)
MPSLRVDARPESLAAIRRFVRAAAAAEGLDRDRAEGLVQAVDESATNVIVHGYRLAHGELEMGVFLARQLCDEVRYRPMPGGGNELALVQHTGNGQRARPESRH